MKSNFFWALQMENSSFLHLIFYLYGLISFLHPWKMIKKSLLALQIKEVSENQ